jgi:manganese-dependent inorganic pyrophosphatase
MIYIAGHKSPDTDSICAAIAYAELKNKQGVDAVPCRLGDINSETKFVLEKWKLDIPQLLDDATNKQLIIVDHSEIKQGPNNMDKAEIIEVVDHHKIGDIQTSMPIMFISKPVGCTCTVIYDLFKEQGVEPSREVKGLILSSILSDTWIFKSSTNTSHDKDIATALADQLDINNIEEYGMEMFKSKIDFHSKTPEQIMKNDYKIYEFSNGSAYINAYELIAGADELVEKREEILKEMKKLSEKHKTVMFVIIDILKNQTHMFTISEFEKDIGTAYKTTFENNYTKLPRLISRKKQIVPVLDKIMN